MYCGEGENRTVVGREANGIVAEHDGLDEANVRLWFKAGMLWDRTGEHLVLRMDLVQARSRVIVVVVRVDISEFRIWKSWTTYAEGFV